MSDAAGLLGLAARARKVVSGEMMYEQLAQHRVFLLIMAEDIGANAKKKLTDKCSFYNVRYVYMDGVQLNTAMGNRNRKAVAVLDKGFAEKIAACLKG